MATQTPLAKQLLALAADTSVSGIKIVTNYEAGGGTITPPAGHLKSMTNTPGLFKTPDGKQAVTLDTPGSQANRIESALKAIAGKISYPLIEVQDPDGNVISTSLDWPHRHADVHHRMLAEPLKEKGLPYEEIMRASESSPAVLLKHFPFSIIGGWWHSQLNRSAGDLATISEKLVVTSKKSKTTAAQAKALASSANGFHTAASSAMRSGRVLTSEIIAHNVTVRPRLAARVDPFGAFPAGVKVTKKAAGKDKSVSVGYSSLGLGNLPPMDAPCDVVAETIVGTTFLSLSMLRRFALDDRDRSVVLALMLLGIQAADTDLHLRSGADLIRMNRSAILAQGESPVTFKLPTVSSLITFLKAEGDRLGWEVTPVLATDAYLQAAKVAAEHTAAVEAGEVDGEGEA